MPQSSIRSQTLWALFSVAGLATLLAGAVTTVTMTREVYLQVGASNRSLAGLLAAHVREEMEDGSLLLERVSHKVRGQALEPELLEPILASALEFNPLFESIYVYDSSGNVVIRRYLTHQESGEGRSRSLHEKDDPAFVEAALACLADGQARKLPVRVTSRGSLFIPLLTAIGEPGERPTGLLSGAIFAGGRGFQEMIQSLAPGKKGFALLLDQGDRVLARTPRGPGVVGEAIDLVFEESWGESLVRHRGGVAFVALATIPEAGLRILVALPREEALASLPRVLTQVALAALVALILAGALGYMLAERLTGPLRELLEGIHKISDGALAHRVPVSGDDEIAQVGRAINRLAESLARSRMIETIWVDPELTESQPGLPERIPPDES